MTEICRFYKGEFPVSTDEPNNNCGSDGLNCDNPHKPCSIHFDKAIK